MQISKSKKISIYIFLLILLGSVNNISLNKIQFEKIEKINVSGLDESDNQKLLKEIKNLNLENIFFINRNEINTIINSNSLVETYDIFKKYPSRIDVKLKKTNFLAKINLDGQIFFIGSNGKLTQSFFINEDLPFIFGNPNINEFLKFKKIIDNSKISYENIKSLFFFRTKRWDIELKNNILIKLSRDNVEKDLNNVYLFLDKENDSSKKIIDARIQNQIITNE